MSIKSCKHLKQLDCAFPTDIRDTVGVASVIYFTGLNRGKQRLRFQSLKSENEKQIFSLSIFSMKYCLLRWLRLPARKSIYSSSLELLLLRQYLEREHETCNPDITHPHQNLQCWPDTIVSTPDHIRGDSFLLIYVCLSIYL